MNKYPAVRVLPMNLKKEFSGLTLEEVQTQFFLRDLPRRQECEYWYRQSGLRADPGSLILFQSDAKIIASAILKQTERFDKPENGYGGKLLFEPTSIRTFSPVTLGELRKVWSGVKQLTQARLYLDPSKATDFEKGLVDVRKMTAAQQIIAAITRLKPSDEKFEFTRDQIRKEIGIDSKLWSSNYSPIFQAMRADQAGGAPKLAAVYRGMFQQVKQGVHKLTVRGEALMRPVEAQKAVDAKSQKLVENGYFSLGNLKEENERKVVEIAQRRGQPKFRKDLVKVYDHCCVITGCSVMSALEAAHIAPYQGASWNHVCNGLLLRADIHTLFDLNLIGIEPKSLKVYVAQELEGSSYEKYAGKRIARPNQDDAAPNVTMLTQRWDEFSAAAL